MLDPLGHHASTCKPGGEVAFRHNRLHDIVAESCRLAHLSVKVEAGNDLTPDHSHTRPADVLVQNWSRGRPAAFDICVTSQFNTLTLSEVGVCAGAAAQAGEARKQPRLERPGSSPGWRGQEAAQAGEARKQPRLERPGSSPGWRGQEAAQAGEARKQPRLERPGSSPGWRGQEAAQAGEARKQPRLERPGSSPGWRGQEAAQAGEARKQPRLERPGSSPGWRGQEAAQAGEARKQPRLERPGSTLLMMTNV